MNIFVINSGSSSIKYQLFRMPNEYPVCSGLVERIGLENATITHKVYTNGEESRYIKQVNIASHEEGLDEVTRLLTDSDIGVIDNPSEIEIVGHRVVHGGESFSETTEITEEVKKEIKRLFSLAPLHNPANYKGIEVAEKIFTNARQIAVFDTAFHQTMPMFAYRFAIPENLYKNEGIRAYGFHGTSHKYVSQKAIELLQNPFAKIISIHLGNGCSITAVQESKSVDTSMGFGPLNGLVMGTRSGDIDPSIIFHLVNQLGHSLDEVNNLLNKQSGMLGMAGFSDMRDIIKAIKAGDKAAELAYHIYAYRIKKYIGSYTAVMNGVDAIVFTGGVGENDSLMRSLICSELDYLGILLSKSKNSSVGAGIHEINDDASKAKILVIPTNEELEIAKQCYELAIHEEVLIS